MNNELNYRLRRVREIVSQYPAAAQYKKDVNDFLEKTESKNYRVAVIGEFNRGKSSLINALLGLEVLPTDILPTTAVVNRIVYDTEQKVVIRYKDGHSEETSYEKLANYATKLDVQKAVMAAEIEEIVVHCPSVLGQNGIELVDTPGLNDDESMSKKTLDALDKIDTAIVVLSASMPLSITEQQLITDLIYQQNIHHLTFVITFIDRYDDEEVEAICETIVRRIRENTYEKCKNLWVDNKELVDKSKMILEEPAVYCVSSKLAMNGIINNDMKMLQKSRFPHFKMQLMSRLTSTFEKDIEYRAKQLLKQSYDEFHQWSENKFLKFENEKRNNEKIVSEIRENLAGRKKEITEFLKSMETWLKDNGMLKQDYDERSFADRTGYKKIFIKHLTGISIDDYCNNAVRTAIKNSVEEIVVNFKNTDVKIRNAFDVYRSRIFKITMDANEKCLVETDGLRFDAELSIQSDLPVLSVSYDDIIAGITDLSGNVMPEIVRVCDCCIDTYCRAVLKYAETFEMHLWEYEKAIEKNIEEMIAMYESIMLSNEEAAERFEYESEINAEEIEKLSEKI